MVRVLLSALQLAARGRAHCTPAAACNRQQAISISEGRLTNVSVFIHFPPLSTPHSARHQDQTKGVRLTVSGVSPHYTILAIHVGTLHHGVVLHFATWKIVHNQLL